MGAVNIRFFNAAEVGDLDAVKTALTDGANIEAVTDDNHRNTALIVAAGSGQADVVGYLISQGANIEAQNDNGWTALMVAASNVHDQITNVLLSNGANTNTQDNSGYTALMLAAYYGHKGAVEVLLSHGADISIKNENGDTALDLVIKQCYFVPGKDYPMIIKVLSNPPTTKPAASFKISRPTSSRVSHVIASILHKHPPPSARDGLSSSSHSQIGQPKTVPSSEMDRCKQDNNSRLQTENNQLTTMNSKLQADLQRLQTDLQRERDTASKLQADLQREHDTASKLQADLQREHDTASRLQADLQSKCDIVGLVQRELQEKDHLLRLQHDQNQQLHQLEADNRRLVHQIQNLQSRLTESTDEVNEFRFTRIQIPHQDQDSWNVPRHEVNIQMKLGEGAWGSVHKGAFRGQQVAVKLIHKEILQEYTIDQMKREIRVMSHIQHPNLVRLIAAVVDGEVEQCTNSPLLILELLHSNLRTAYSERELTRNVLISIFRDVAYALHYLHEHQEPIIHRDVSAPNVLLEELSSGGWRAKLSDFGSANIARDCKTAAPGAIVYSAPETYPPGNPYDPLPKQTTKIDVFSYGYVIAEVIAQEMPALEKRRQMLISIERQWRSMYELIMECISYKPEDRSTITQVLHRLNSLPPQ